MDELADQLTGVLHEIAAADSGHPQPRISSHFSPQRAIYGSGLGRAAVDGVGDRGARRAQGRRQRSRRSAAGHDERHTARPTGADAPARRRRRATIAATPSRYRCDWSVHRWSSAAAKDARRRLAELESVIPGDWRLTWYSGQCALLEGDFDAAAADFDAVLTMLPGELDPKLALAATAELRGAYDEAARYYETVWRTNHSSTARRSAWRGCEPGRATVPAPSPHLTRSPLPQRISPRQARPRSRYSSTAGPPTTSTNRRCSMRASARRR